MDFYVCKMCGRGLRSTLQPTFCYADRMTHMEGIDPASAAQMNLFSSMVTWVADDGDTEFEFPADVRFDPFTGEKYPVTEEMVNLPSLSDFQDRIIKEMV